MLRLWDLYHAAAAHVRDDGHLSGRLEEIPLGILV